MADGERARDERFVADAIRGCGYLTPKTYLARCDMAHLEFALGTLIQFGTVLCIYLDNPRSQCVELASVLARNPGEDHLCLCFVISAESCDSVQCHDFAAEVLAVTDALPAGHVLDICVGGDLIHMVNDPRSPRNSLWSLLFVTTALKSQSLFYSLLTTHPWNGAEVRCEKRLLFAPETSLVWLRSHCTQSGKVVRVCDRADTISITLQSTGCELAIKAWPTDAERVMRDLLAQVEDVVFSANALPLVFDSIDHPDRRKYVVPMSMLCKVLTAIAPDLPERGAKVTLDVTRLLDWDYRGFAWIPAPIGITSPAFVRQAGSSTIRPVLDREKTRIAIFIASVMRQSEIDNIVYLDRVIDYYVDREWRYLCTSQRVRFPRKKALASGADM